MAIFHSYVKLPAQATRPFEGQAQGGSSRAPRPRDSARHVLKFGPDRFRNAVQTKKRCER